MLRINSAPCNLSLMTNNRSNEDYYIETLKIKKIENIEKYIERRFENIVQLNIIPKNKTISRKALINKILDHKY